MTKLELLYAQKSKKFDQLCALAARELRYGELSTLSTEDRMRVEDEATQYVEQWEETDEMKTNFTIRPTTPLRVFWPSITTSANEFWTSMRLTPVFGNTGKEPRSADVRCPFKSRTAYEPKWKFASSSELLALHEVRPTGPFPSLHGPALVLSA